MLQALLLGATLSISVAADSGAGASGDPDAGRTDAGRTGPGSTSAGRMDAAPQDATAQSPPHERDSADEHSDTGAQADAVQVTASTGQHSDWEPTPFSASYEARYDGIPFTATGTRTLEIDADGILHFSSRVETWLLKLEEQATMELSDAGYLRPLEYAYRIRGVARRTRRLDFDWAAGVVHRSGDSERSAPLEAPAYDPVSWQLALQRDLARGAHAPGTVLRYPVADGGDVKVYEIVVRGPEQLELATGTEQTVFLERLHAEDAGRSTRVWLSPERDWMLVKLEVVDDDGRMLQLSLQP